MRTESGRAAACAGGEGSESKGTRGLRGPGTSYNWPVALVAQLRKFTQIVDSWVVH